MDTQRTSSGLSEEVQVATAITVNLLAVLMITTPFDLSRRRLFRRQDLFLTAHLYCLTLQVRHRRVLRKFTWEYDTHSDVALSVANSRSAIFAYSVLPSGKMLSLNS
mgnify:CR=1 FL=1